MAGKTAAAGTAEAVGAEGDEAGEEVRPRIMRAAALSMTGDFLLLVGLLFVLLGIAAFVTDFLRVKGSGETVVGGLMIVVAVALLMRSRAAMPRMPGAPKPQRPMAMEKSGSYR